MIGHHWINFVAVVQLVGGLLLLVGRFVPLALTLLAPVIVNILLYHALLWPHGYGFAIVVLIAELFLLAVYWRSFAPLALSQTRKQRRRNFSAPRASFRDTSGLAVDLPVKVDREAMKVLAIVCRILLGLVFVFFGCLGSVHAPATAAARK